MKNSPRLHLCWIFAIASILLGGCVGTSRPVEFYTLSSLARLNEKTNAETTGSNVAVGLGPLSVPSYLTRPQIVTRPSTNRIVVSEFHRWGSDLEEDILRVLADNISILLGTNHVAIYPWGDRFNPKYRITLDVKQFEGQLGGYVQLNVIWTLMVPESEEKPLVKKLILREPATTKGFEGLVSAKSRALAVLSRKIADEIGRIQKRGDRRQKPE